MDKDTELKKAIRLPKQSRSIEMKEKILNTAYSLFCEKGYYGTTTNEIAKVANVSIGSLYSYFKDKDTIFLEILDRYHSNFDLVKNELISDYDFFNNNMKKWLRTLIEILIKIHEDTRELTRELNVVSYYNPKVAEILDKNRAESLNSVIKYFKNIKNIKSEDTDAAAIVLYDLISSVVDRIVFGKNEMDRDRLIDAAVEVIYNFAQ